MAAFLRNVGGASFNGPSSTISAASGGGQVDDARYLFATSNVQSLTLSGWTQLYSATLTGGCMGLWWRPYIVGEPTTFLNLSSAGDCVVIVVSVAGASVTGTPQSTTNTGSGTTLSATGLTPAIAGDVQLCFFSTQVTANATTATLSAPSGFSVSNTYNPTTASGQVGMLAYRSLSSTAATGNATSTSSQTGTWRTATALHPPGPVVTGTKPGSFMGFFGGGI